MVKKDVIFGENCHISTFPDFLQNEKDAQRNSDQSCVIFAMRSLFWTCLVKKVLLKSVVKSVV